MILKLFVRIGRAHALYSRRAVNLALITSEGVTNALKHAFPEFPRTGTVSVSCSRDGAS